jgi:uncharacterized BrkB/YihY/UPF0761 family membrane protein
VKSGRARAAAERTRARVEEGRTKLEAARPRVPAIDAALGTYERDRDAAAGLLAGALAYRFFITLLPLTLLLVVGLGYASAADQSAPADAAREFGISAAAATSVADSARASSGSRLVALLVGAGALLYAAWTAVRAVRLTHAIAWQLPERRWPRSTAAGLAYIGVVVLAGTITSGSAWLREQIGTPGILVTLATTAIYFGIWLWASWHLPHGAVGWKDLVPGAIVVAVGFQVLQLITFLYVSPRLDSATAAYGALGVALVLLLWLYLLGRLVVGSAILNATLSERRSPPAFATPPSSPRP